MIKDWEDRQIIGTGDYDEYQAMVTEAGLFAVQEARARGLPITGVENNQIIKVYADGRREILGTVKPPVSVDRSVFVLPPRSGEDQADKK
jgi:hypothetical protein